MPAPDAQLRANIRLLGDVLGQVLVEQEGEELLAVEEQIRRLARSARETGDRSELGETIRSLGLERQSAVLRAFALFFQLANLAEQHHRLRRRRRYEHEGRVPRESLGDAIGRLRDAGLGGEELRKAAERLEARLVLTAHPTEATRRTILQAHLRLATLLRRLDDHELPDSGAAACGTAGRGGDDPLADGRGALARPRVVDEIRHGLWFVEGSLWSTRCRGSLRELRAAIPGAPPPLRFGTLDRRRHGRQPERGRGDDRRCARARAPARAGAPARRSVRALGSAWGMSPSSSIDRRAVP